MHRSLVVMVLVVLSSLAMCASLPSPQEVSAEPTPMVNVPAGDGQYEVGWYYGMIQTSTKSYSVEFRVDYPAGSRGYFERPDMSSAPYPAVIWLPGFGGTMDSYGAWTERLCTWGFVVMSISVNWNDWPNSADVSDIEEFIDYLEEENSTSSHHLYGVIDTGAVGLSGHSSGGGLSLVDGAYVDRITAVHPFAAAIGASAVDSIAPSFHKPLMLQVGKEDATYIEGSRRSYQKIEPVNNLVETRNAGHGGPYQMWLWHAFYLYHLGGQSLYRDLLYGEQAIAEYAAGDYDLKFKLSDEVYFPPKVHASVSATEVDIGGPVTYTGTIDGYAPLGLPQLSLEWDLDSDGMPERASSADPNVTWVWDRTGTFTATFTLSVGRYSHTAPEPIAVTVSNVPPIAVALEDMTIDQDAIATFDATGCNDTPGDRDRLTYHWDFGDGEVRDFAPDPVAIHRYTVVGVYDVVLTVRDPYGAEDRAGLDLTVVNVPPTVRAASVEFTYEDLEVPFEGYATDTPSDRPHLRFQWDFGDGFSTDWTPGSNTSHVYTASGNYTVVLSVKDPNGAVVSDSVHVLVQNLPPTAEVLSPSSGAAFDEDIEIDFKGSASDTSSDNDSLAYRWDYGDGEETGWGSYSLLTTSHTYTRAGVYQATLFIMDNDEEMIWDSVTINIDNPPPEAWTGVSSLVVDEDEGFTISGDGTDTESDLATLGKAWLVDDQMVLGTVLSWRFAEAGEYVVVFRVVDDDGDLARVDVLVTVLNVEPSGTAGLDRTSMREGDSLNFTATVEDTSSDYSNLSLEWVMGDGTVYDTLVGNHTYNEKGVYIINFTAMDDNGATFFKSFTITVQERHPDDPPRPPDDDDDDDGSSFPTVAVAAGALAAVLLVVAAVLLARRRPSGGEPPADGAV